MCCRRRRWCQCRQAKPQQVDFAALSFQWFCVVALCCVVVLCCAVLCCAVLCCVVLCCVVLFCFVLYCLLLVLILASCGALPGVILSCLVLPCLVLSCLVSNGSLVSWGDGVLDFSHWGAWCLLLLMREWCPFVSYVLVERRYLLPTSCSSLEVS